MLARCVHRIVVYPLAYRRQNRASIIEPSVFKEEHASQANRSSREVKGRSPAWRRAAVISGIAAMLLGTLAAAQFKGFSADFLDLVRDEYGGRAKRTMERWEKLVAEARTLPELDKLEAVNLFFNKNIWFTDDIQHWRRKDYWATPMETMATLEGDCEDFVIAKYFTLREVGVADEKLRLTYVRSTRVNQAHMVLTYFTSPDAEPLVLDNLTDYIDPASRRRDLTPVYSFNGRSLWRAKEFGRGREIGAAGRVDLWAGVIRRMRKEPFPY